mmetsp:Transcript_535/g.1062  ORF Transcript_535/g.1062 Transcript_535/m.1062 type:complete len:819 (-) Transcript_535:316-2772(-)|eukprot:CAMPEP_0172319482 /NCGR_PEP_ID=MMETSP1058-20130122/37775_1 /TAXON_ID=83371 /ORGANISM="Detonula confervacea, Strain CCMP 353" /LENGTH=818 /DNA_ID=CAMNT_0013034533 /DNA_START=45 /DNA_END=2501 /DNA_ORIENTATION=-
MALRGDDEMDSLLSSWGQTSTSTSYTSVKPPTSTGTSSSKPSLESDDQANKEKTKKRKKKKKRPKTKEDGNRNNGEKITSFADTRLSQNCFEWPSSLILGSGLLHNCKGYSYVCGSNEQNHQNGCYGSIACQSCGKSAVTHELCLSSSLAESVDDKIKTFHPLSIMAVASIIVASRNARCLIGEHYPVSKDEKQKKKPQIGELSTNHLLPPLNSIPSSPEMISNALDVHVGRILVSVKKMQNELAKPNHRPRHNDKMQEEHSKFGSIASISESDAQLLQEKTSALISTVQDYKKSIAAANSSTRSNATNRAAINLVEKRLAAMASCDTVYYRCYYAAVVSQNSTENTGGVSVMAAMIPHPPTYFSCPGLSWDVQNSGVESFRMFVGECNNNLGLAAPLNDSTKQVLLKSWGLKERLSSTTVGKEGNPFLTLWQSRFLESIRHMWSTRYSAVKSPIALREASNSTNHTDRAQEVVPHNSQESQLKFHETDALSPAVAQWRDSIRDYPANFYAYAAPTNEALQTISNCLGFADVEQILEAGAGTGYWSALLLSHLKHNGKKSKGLKKDDMAPTSAPMLVQPYDIAPPSSEAKYDDRSAVSNEYHGNIPTFTDVHQANTLSQALSTSATNSSNMAMLLCYPPPGSDMAQRALSAHIFNGGRTVMHIGEWQGLTGDSTFETLLTQEFCCQEKDVVPLPLWGTDATYLTIWRKKGGKEGGDAQSTGTVSCSPAFGYCSVDHCSNLARRRCRYARCLQYCSLECFEKHSSQRGAMLALHMIQTTSKDGLEYEDDGHFMDLNHTTAFEPESSSERAKKKRKKKRR